MTGYEFYSLSFFVPALFSSSFSNYVMFVSITFFFFCLFWLRNELFFRFLFDYYIFLPIFFRMKRVNIFRNTEAYLGREKHYGGVKTQVTPRPGDRETGDRRREKEGEGGVENKILIGFTLWISSSTNKNRLTKRNLMIMCIPMYGICMYVRVVYSVCNRYALSTYVFWRSKNSTTN